MLLGIIRGLETVSDVLEYGLIEAVKINTSICPEAERGYRRIMADIDKPSQVSDLSVLLSEELCNHEIADKEPTEENLEEFSAWIDEIKKNFSEESGNIDLRLIYDYSQLNVYGKMIMGKVCSSTCDLTMDLSFAEKKIEALRFMERCQQGEDDKYSFIFWALLVLTVDDTDKEEYLSQICDLGSCLGIDDEEMMNIARLIRVV